MNMKRSFIKIPIFNVFIFLNDGAQDFESARERRDCKMETKNVKKSAGRNSRGEYLNMYYTLKTHLNHKQNGHGQPKKRR